MAKDRQIRKDMVPTLRILLQYKRIINQLKPTFSVKIATDSIDCQIYHPIEGLHLKTKTSFWTLINWTTLSQRPFLIAANDETTTHAITASCGIVGAQLGILVLFIFSQFSD